MEQPNWYEVRSFTHAPERRAYHSSFVWDSILYVYGGEDSHEGLHMSMFFMDLSFIRSGSGAAKDNTVASRLQQLNIVPKWTHIHTDPRYKNIPGPLAHGSTIVFNGVAYLYGGVRPDGEQSESLYKFEINFGRWMVAK